MLCIINYILCGFVTSSIFQRLYSHSRESYVYTQHRTLGEKGYVTFGCIDWRLSHHFLQKLFFSSEKNTVLNFRFFLNWLNLTSDTKRLLVAFDVLRSYNNYGGGVDTISTAAGSSLARKCSIGNDFVWWFVWDTKVARNLVQNLFKSIWISMKFE